MYDAIIIENGKAIGINITKMTKTTIGNCIDKIVLYDENNRYIGMTNCILNATIIGAEVEDNILKVYIKLL